MPVVMSLPMHVAPYPDEWLGFYVLRLAKRYHQTFVALLEYVDVRPEKPKTVTWGRFPEFDLAARRQFGAFAHVPLLTLAKMQSLSFRICHRGQWSYCRECLRCDLRSNRTPYWRTCWLDALTLYCPRHRNLLQAVNAAVILPLSNLSGTTRLLNALADTAIPSPEQDWMNGLVQRAPPLRRTFRLAAQFQHNVTVSKSFACLLDHAIHRIERALHDIPSRDALASFLGAPPQSLSVDLGFSWRDPHAASRIGTPRDRALALAIAGTLLGPCDAGKFLPASATLREELRAWIWRSLPEHWTRSSWQLMVQRCVNARLIEPWPDVERWVKPKSDDVGPPYWPTSNLQISPPDPR